MAELLYLQYKDRQKPIYLYINSTGTTRADGETVSTAYSHVALLQHLLHSCQLEPCLSAYIYLLIGESHVNCMQVGFETEGTAIYDTMRFVRNEVSAPSRLSGYKYDVYGADALDDVATASIRSL